MISDWATNGYGVLIAAAVLGLCVGSFLNVVIYRLPIMMERQWQIEAAMVRQEPEPSFPRFDLLKPGSRCPSCEHKITPLENIPLFSYLFLRGKCSQCKAPISIRYPAIEALTAVLSLAVVAYFGTSYFALAALVYVWALIALTFIDLDEHLLPDDITLPLVWGGLLFNMYTQTIPLEESLIGAVAGYLSLWSVYWVFKLLTGKEGMGYGDFKLLSAIGALLGWKVLPAVILLSSVVGSIVGIGLIVFAKHDRDTHIPFGPYLTTAGILALFFGPSLTKLILP